MIPGERPDAVPGSPDRQGDLKSAYDTCSQGLKIYICLPDNTGYFTGKQPSSGNNSRDSGLKVICAFPLFNVVPSPLFLQGSQNFQAEYASSGYALFRDGGVHLLKTRALLSK
jgi:hypothetical protein